MKKIIFSLFALAAMTVAFTSCEDVPEPYNDPNNNSSEVVDIEPSGSGTLEDPYNVAAAIKYIESLESDVESTEDIYIKGIVTTVSEEYSTTYGNGTFYIADATNSSEKFYVYRALYLGNKKYTSGTQPAEGDEVVVCGKVVNYSGNTPETVQNKAYLYSLNGETGGGSGDTGTPSGEGTLDSPYNVAAALQYTSALESNAQSDKDIYIKGIVTSITEEYNTTYGNATYYISDDASASNQFYVFRSLYLGNVKYTSGDQIKVGDEVIICGKVTNYYGNTPETVANLSYLYSLNGKTASGGGSSTTTAEGDGTLENPYNAIAANEYASSLAADTESDKEVYIKGKIASIKESYSTTYGNASFYISADGTSENTFLVYRALYLGNVKYTEGTQPQVGDDVIIYGKVVNFKGNTPETVQNKAYLYSLTSNGGGSGSGDTGDTSTSNGDFETWVSGAPNNWKTTSTAGNATLSQSEDAHGGKYSVKVGGTTSANKRLGYKEMTLKAGEYTMTFYAKAASSTGASVRPGYVPVTDGSVGSYVYGNYTNDITNTTWVQVTHTFTIAADGTYSVVIMNSKNPGGDVLIDDFTLTMGSTVIIK